MSLQQLYMVVLSLLVAFDGSSTVIIYSYSFCVTNVVHRKYLAS